MPLDNSIIESDLVDVQGITDNDTILTVNGEKVAVTNDGKFALNLKLHRGVNVIRVQAVNKANKETAKVLTVEYKPKTAQATEIMYNR
jgi:hypothetical protein